jgi:hypothetical protein
MASLPALASTSYAPVQRLADPPSKCIRTPQNPDFPICLSSSPASGPELHLSLPPATFDVLAELGELAGEVPSAASLKLAI